MNRSTNCEVGMGELRLEFRSSDLGGGHLKRQGELNLPLLSYPLFKDNQNTYDYCLKNLKIACFKIMSKLISYHYVIKILVDDYYLTSFFF